MHLGNGTVTPMCAVYGATAAGAGLAIGWQMARRISRPDPVGFAAACAFVFAAQAFNVPIWPGVSGHLIGAVLLAHLFGSAWGLYGMAAVLAIQSLLFGDGGWIALGLNIFNMGVIPCLVVYPLLKHRGVAIAAWTSVVAASVLCGLQLLSVASSIQQGMGAISSLVGAHLLIGLIEIGVTLSAIEIVRRAGLWSMRVRLAAGVLAPAAVALLASVGASPWPDALEHTMSLYSIAPAANAMVAQADQWQTSIACDYTLVPLVLGTLAVALLCSVACARLGRRLSW